MKKQPLNIGYLFLVLLISVNVYLHRDGGPFDPTREAKTSIFTSGSSGITKTNIAKDGYSTQSSAPEKRKLKIRTRYKAAEEVAILFVPSLKEPSPVFLAQRHTPIFPMLLPGSNHLDFTLRGPPII